MSRIYLYSLLFFSISCFSVNPPDTGKEVVVKWPLDLKVMMFAVCKLSSMDEGSIVITSQDGLTRLSNIGRKNIPESKATLFSQLTLDDNCDRSDEEKYQVLKNTCKQTIGLMIEKTKDLFEEKAMEAIRNAVRCESIIGEIHLQRINTEEGYIPYIYPYDFTTYFDTVGVNEDGKTCFDLGPHVNKFARETAEKHVEANLEVFRKISG